VQEGIDVAIHNGEIDDSTLMARKIAATPIVTVATPAFLKKHGTPTRPGELEGRECIIFVARGVPRPWRYRGKLGEIVHQPRGRLRTNDAEQTRAAVLAGLGLTHTPGWLFTREIESGAVRRLMRPYEREPLAISAVHASGRRLPTKVRVFIDFLAEIFAAEPSLAPGLRGCRHDNSVETPHAGEEASSGVLQNSQAGYAAGPGRSGSISDHRGRVT
jgi:LysR family transcriptional regulator, regulator for bpeEF and oprC